MRGLAAYYAVLLAIFVLTFAAPVSSQGEGETALSNWLIAGFERLVAYFPSMIEGAIENKVFPYAVLLLFLVLWLPYQRRVLAKRRAAYQQLAVRLGMTFAQTDESLYAEAFMSLPLLGKGGRSVQEDCASYQSSIQQSSSSSEVGLQARVNPERSAVGRQPRDNPERSARTTQQSRRCTVRVYVPKR